MKEVLGSSGGGTTTTVKWSLASAEEAAVSPPVPGHPHPRSICQALGLAGGMRERVGHKCHSREGGAVNPPIQLCH